MVIKLFLFISFLLNYVFNHSQFNSCTDVANLTDFDHEVLAIMKENLDLFLNDHEKCIYSLLQTGNYESLEYFINQLMLKKIKFREPLKKAVLNVEAEMKELYNKYRFDEQDFQIVTPVIQWAQNMNQIFLHLKFSHRHDAPGCPEVKNLNIDILPNQLYLTSYCVQAEIPIKFELKLPFFVDVSPEESKHNHESNGRYIFNLSKAQKGMYWDRLVRNMEDYPKHTKVWLEMHEKYKSEIQTYIEDDEDEEYKKLVEELDKKKNKKRKKKVKFNG